jgi:hypothetical protein
MEIKFGDIVLKGWNGITGRNPYYRRIFCREIDHDHKCVIIGEKSNCENSWCAMFYYELDFLNDFCDECIIGMAEEAMQQVDDFLIRMSKLTAFI